MGACTRPWKSTAISSLLPTAAQTCDTLHGVVNLAQMVNDLEFCGQIHFGRAKTVAYGFFR